MKAERIKISLKKIGEIYGGLFDVSHQRVIPEAIASVDASKRAYDSAKIAKTKNAKKRYWGYTIDHDSPLRFKPSTIKPFEFQVDIYCDVQWADDELPVKQNVIVRIWSNHKDSAYRPFWDSKLIRKQLNSPTRNYPGRVMSRFHYDKFIPNDGRSTEHHPEYHLQIGGMAQDYELCWHHRKIDTPRLIHQPMDLLLTCEMIAANFFLEEYLVIREKREWIDELAWCQELLLSNYYQNCLNTIRNGRSLLSSLEVS